MDEVHALMQRQLGLVTWRQAATAGVTHAVVKGRVARGEWRRDRRGVYASNDVPATYEQSVLAAVLAVTSGPAYASHRTAGRLRTLRVPPPEDIDVLTLSGTRINLSGVAQHRTNVISRRDLSAVGPVPATSAARTLVDCLPWLPGRAFGLAVDDAQRRSLVAVNDVDTCLAELDQGRRSGRRLIVPAREAIAARVAGRMAGGSERELVVLDALEQAGLPLPVQQYEIVIDGHRYIIDFAYPVLRIGLEFDGFAEHGLIRSTFDNDRTRGNRLRLAGWMMLHFTSSCPVPEIVTTVGRALAMAA